MTIKMLARNSNKCKSKTYKEKTHLTHWTEYQVHLEKTALNTTFYLNC